MNDFSKAIDLHPIYVSALYSRGVLYWRELENYYRSVKDLTRVIELAPQWHEAWFNRALAHQLRNEIPERLRTTNTISRCRANPSGALAPRHNWK